MFSIKYDENNLDSVYDHYQQEFYKNLNLINHRVFVENNNLGFGERPFHALWNEIISSMSDVSFLEIGVYKGQILSLVKYLCKLQNKNCDILGITPLNDTGDKFSNYQQCDYLGEIQKIFNKFDLELQQNELLVGLSTNIDIINKIVERKYNLIYVDGGHDYESVRSDIEVVKKCLSSGGIVVFDDSSSYKKFNKSLFLGHIDVANALKNHLENDTEFEEIMCVGHNRAFRKK